MEIVDGWIDSDGHITVTDNPYFNVAFKRKIKCVKGKNGWEQYKPEPELLGVDHGSKDGDYSFEVHGYRTEDGKTVITKAKYSN